MDKKDGIKWTTITQVAMFDSMSARESADLDAIFNGASHTGLQEVKRIEGNLGLNEGLNAIWKLVTGDGSVAEYTHANARIGVGDSDDSEAATQTGLEGASQFYEDMDTAYPKVENQSVEFQSTFDEDTAGTSETPMAWNEWTVDNGDGEGGELNLNRKVEYIGTKAGGVWVLRVTLTLS